MRCHFPNCHNTSRYTPVITLPTLDSRGGSTREPTYLLGGGVCLRHKNSYNLLDWFRRGDWNALRDAARDKGLTIPEPDMITVEFKPVGWQPRHHLELGPV